MSNSPTHSRAGASLIELMMVLFISGMVASNIRFDLTGKISEMGDAKATSDLVATIRDCRFEALARNATVKWWIADHYLVWWEDANQDAVADPEEVETIPMSDEVAYATYPARGAFNGRGEHYTDYAYFPGMYVWLYGDTGARLVTVSANGHVSQTAY